LTEDKKIASFESFVKSRNL